jgi:hypothetical protein
MAKQTITIEIRSQVDAAVEQFNSTTLQDSGIYYIAR